jgi:cation:H+ antiporter
MWPAYGSILVGLALLVWSADKFVEGATSFARHLGVSTMIIGITVVGFGTSAPEILVSVIAVLEDTPDLAIGNALGSNIANIGLILGVTALITPLPIAKITFKREYPLLIFATGVMSWCLYDGTRADVMVSGAITPTRSECKP